MPIVLPAWALCLQIQRPAGAEYRCPKAILLKGPVYEQMLFAFHNVIVARPLSPQEVHAAVARGVVMQGMCMPQLAVMC